MLEHGYKVEIKKLSCRPSRFSDSYILKNITLTIEPGEFVAIVGPNGAGKSSIVKAIAGELENITGSIVVGGQPIKKPINRIIDGVGIVHQIEGVDLIDHLSVAQNIAIRQLLGGGHNSGIFAITDRWRTDIATALGSIANLSNFDLDEIVRNLNGGHKQMLSVAISVYLEHKNNPCRLLLLDEHTSRLDHCNAIEVMNYTAEQAKNINATTIVVTHRHKEVITHADRVIVIRNGSVVCNIRKEELINKIDLEKCIEGESCEKKSCNYRCGKNRN